MRWIIVPSRPLLPALALLLAACGGGPNVTLEGVEDGGTVSRSQDSGKVVLVVPKGENAMFFVDDRPALAYNRGDGRFELRLSRIAPGEHVLKAVDHTERGPKWRFTVVE